MLKSCTIPDTVGIVILLQLPTNVMDSNIVSKVVRRDFVHSQTGFIHFTFDTLTVVRAGAKRKSWTTWRLCWSPARAHAAWWGAHVVFARGTALSQQSWKRTGDMFEDDGTYSLLPTIMKVDFEDDGFLWIW